ncbi:MAG: succinate dehydrogenase assembly factor 2 [Steroidobacteraceae bacterium]
MSAHRSILTWRCRRGVKELDLLLLGWLERYFEAATAEERAAFAALLELPDPQLACYLLGNERPEQAVLRAAVAAVRGEAGTFHRSGDSKPHYVTT